MASFENSTFASFYKRIFQVDQGTANAGVSGTTKQILSGDGAASSMSVSDDVFQVQPQNNDSSGTMLVKNQAGTTILSVDTTNTAVKVGTAQINPLTYFQEFGIFDVELVQGYHYPLYTFPSGYSGNETFSNALGTGSSFDNEAEPATSLDISTGLSGKLEQYTACLWYVPYNIEIDEVRYFSMCSSSSAVTTNYFLFWYTIDTTTEHGDLSGGTKIAEGQAEPILTKVYIDTLSLESDTTVAAGKVILGFIEEVDANPDQATAKLIVKYHIV